jgi:RNA polymerase sigma-70 factor (ECF subfamily)
VADDLLLLERARRLEPEALAEIHSTYYQRIFRYIEFRVDDASIIPDLASEVFVRLIDAIREDRAPRDTLKGWLYKVASHVISEHWREQKRSVTVDLEESMASHDDDLLTQLESRLSAASLQRAIAKLTREQQMVITLRFASEMPIRDVAQIIGKSEGAVKQLQARAMVALTHLLAGEGEE